MRRRDEQHILEALDRIIQETHENNIMLRQICQVLNTIISRHHQENEDDFGRNVMANLVSEVIGRKGR